MITIAYYTIPSRLNGACPALDKFRARPLPPHATSTEKGTAYRQVYRQPHPNMDQIGTSVLRLCEESRPQLLADVLRHAKPDPPTPEIHHHCYDAPINPAKISEFQLLCAAEPVR